MSSRAARRHLGAGRPGRRRHVLVTVAAVLTTLLGATDVASATPLSVPRREASDPAPRAAVDQISMRDGTRSMLRQNGLGDSVVRVGTASYGSSTLAATFRAGPNGGADDLDVSVTSGLAPGTYRTSRLPGAADALLDPGNFLPCGNEEFGSLTVTEASWNANGTPATFAGSFTVDSCDGEPAVTGALLWHSTVLSSAAAAPSSVSAPGIVTVNSTLDVPVTVTAAGNAPVTLGAVVATQSSPTNGEQYWSTSSDSCSHATLDPGESCAVVLRVAPLRPNGYPRGEVAAEVTVPDGGTNPVSVRVSAEVAPLGGQPLALQAFGGVRRTTLSWGAPAALGQGWVAGRPVVYTVYELVAGGGEVARLSTSELFAAVTQPDQVARTYVVRAAQAGTEPGPASLPASATTVRRELLLPTSDEGVVGVPVDPSGTGVTLVTRDQTWLGDPTTRGLALSRDQSVVTWTEKYTPKGDTTTSTVVRAADLRAAGTRSYLDLPARGAAAVHDGFPAVSPDGSTIAFARSGGGAAAGLRLVGLDTGTSVTIPGSADLSQPAFSADGRRLIAVRTTNVVHTVLVSVDPATGAQQTVAATDGLTSPDVGPNGRIVAVQWAQVDGVTVSRLVSVVSGGVPTPIAGADTGWNTRPRISPDGRTVYFLHAAGTDSSSADAYSVTLSTGAVTRYTHTGGVSTPVVLSAFGADTTPPSVTVTAPTSGADLSGRATVSWTVSDPLVGGATTSGVQSSDVRYRTASAGGPFGAYAYPSAWQHHSSARTAGLTTRAGVEYCFSVRARDGAGNVSAWTADRCTTTPLDDRALTTGARRITAAGYYGGTASRSTVAGTTFRRSGVAVSRVGVLVTTCATCGRLDVSIGSAHLGRVSTAATRSHSRVLLWLPVTRVLSGTLILRAVDKRQVVVDGVLLTR